MTGSSLAPVVIPNTDRFPHVARGGSWADKPNRLRSASRRGSDKTWIKRDPQRPQWFAVVPETRFAEPNECRRGQKKERSQNISGRK